MFEHKPDFATVLERYEAWWRCEILDRPLVGITYNKPADQCKPLPAKTYANEKERWLDAETQALCKATDIGNKVFAGDSLPIAWPNLGPEVFSAYYGCEMEYGPRTAWSKPILHDLSPESIAGLKLDFNNYYFRKTEEMTDALLALGRGKFIVGSTDLHGGGDAIAAFRDPQELLIDTLENPEAIKSLCDRITDDFLKVYDHFNDKLAAAGMPSTSWLGATCKGKYHIPSNDFSCMIADDAFEDLLIPGIIRECQHMDRCIYHLDGPQALRYLDRLLDIPEIHAIQWVPGAGRDNWRDNVPVYQRIQQRGKALQFPGIPVKDLPAVMDVLHPQGVWLSNISGISNAAEAAAVLKTVAAWR